MSNARSGGSDPKAVDDLWAAMTMPFLLSGISVPVVVLRFWAALAREIAGSEDADAAPTAFDQEPEDRPVIYRTTQAARWLAQARDILPPGRTIIRHYETCRMIRCASTECGNVGYTGMYFVFGDGSRIQSEPDQDRLLGGVWV
jgi:hypothetical protein